MKEQIAAGIVRHRWWVLGLLIIATGVAAQFAAEVTWDSRLDIFFLEDDKAPSTYRSFLERFQTDERVVIAFASDAVFARENLEVIRRLTRRLETVDHVIRVSSLTNVVIPQAIEDGLAVGPLVNEIPVDPDELQRIEDVAMKSRLLKGTLLAPEGGAAAIVLHVEEMQDRIDAKLEMLEQIRSTLAEEDQGTTKAFVAGKPVFDEAFFLLTQRDFTRLLPVIFVLTVVTIAFLFRRLLAIWVTFAVLMMVFIWTFGFMGCLGYKINIVSSIFACLILAIGIADSVHLLSSYYDTVEMGQEGEEAIRSAVVNVYTPCLFTTLTTAAGLLSLTVSRLAPLRELGIIGAAGVLFAFLISMVIIPLALSFSKGKPIPRKRSSGIGSLVRITGLLAKLGTAYPAVVVTVSLVASLGSIYLVKDLPIGINYIETLGEERPERKAIEFVDAHIGGTISIEFVLEGKQEEAFKDPEVLRRMEDLERYVNDLPGVTGSYSLCTYLKEMNRLMFGGDPRHFVLPSTRELVGQYLLLMESGDGLEEIVQSDYRVARISSRLRMRDGLALAKQVEGAEKYVRREFSESFQVEATGLVKVLNDMEKYLFSTQVRSFSIAFLVVLIMMAVVLKSVRLGVFAMIPNFLPILLTLGIMSAADIPLNMGTVCIASILLGVVVDDTIHFLYRLKKEVPHAEQVADAVQAAIRGVGVPLLSTSIILIIGFGALCFASFQPNVHFGYVAVTAVFLAFFCDVVILPAVIVLLQPRFVRSQRRMEAETGRASG
jgi:hydrophobe/amphiphile efflux-3 (HAE3) family protein